MIHCDGGNNVCDDITIYATYGRLDNRHVMLENSGNCMSACSVMTCVWPTRLFMGGLH